MITILNYKKNKKITVRPCPKHLKNKLQEVSSTQRISDVWQADESQFEQIVATLAELQAEGLIEQTSQGRYVMSSKYTDRKINGNF